MEIFRTLEHACIMDPKVNMWLSGERRNVLCIIREYVRDIQSCKDRYDGSNPALEEAAEVLFRAASDPANRVAIRVVGGIDALLMRKGDSTTKFQFWAARALERLSYDAANRVAIVDSEAGGIEALVTVVANGSSEFQEAIVAAGAVDPLIALVRDASENLPLKRMAAAALEHMKARAAALERLDRKKLLVLRALVTCGRAEPTLRTAPSVKWLLGAGSFALPNELTREILSFWRATRILKYPVDGIEKSNTTGEWFMP